MGTSRSAQAASFVYLNRQRACPSFRPGVTEFLSRLSRELSPRGDFAVVLVSDRVIRRYNRRYRGHDAPTDVLSFEGEGGYLGDIVISAETASRQASASRTLTLETNVKRLALHGLLHLMGYDHEVDNGEMRAVESRLRRRYRC